MSDKQKGKEKKNEYIQMAAQSSRSEEQFKDKDKKKNLEVENTGEKQSFISRYQKPLTYGGGTFGVAILVYLITQQFTPDFVFESQYQFTIYCPINTTMINLYKESQYELAASLQQRKAQNDLRVLTQQFSQRLLLKGDDSVKFYLIYVQAHNITSGDQNVTRFTYCSWVSDWADKDCKNPRRVCTVPGPLFYVQRNQTIDVAWVYSLDNTYGITADNTCFTNDPTNHHCQLPKKSQPGCTYADPTSDSTASHFSNDTFVINTTSIPISVHVHGLQVRPVFDGNPLSWLGSGDQLGSGYQSLVLNKKYFESFRDPEVSQFIPQSPGSFYYKVNRYHNFQPPGNLWYHDHSMHITKGNVMLGMAGDYIIHDKKVDSQLPTDQNEIFIVASENFNKQDGINKKKLKENKTLTQQNHGIRYNPPEVPFATMNLTFKRNQTYRVRILNAQFDSTFQNLRFVTQCKNTQPVDPATCNKTLKFTVIGSDSCLFHQTVPNVTNLTLGSAERFEILIVFDGDDGNGKTENPISSQVNFVYLVTSSTDNTSTAYIRLKYPLEKVKSVNTHCLPQDKLNITGITFYNLTQPHIGQKCPPNVSSPSCLSVERMRPFFISKRGLFHFNGHYEFGASGASDNPKIGTTQDWYFINTMWFPHPIHVHLINLQVVNKTTLAWVNYTYTPDEKGKVSYQCSFYEMDYYVQSGAIPDQYIITYADICYYIRNTLNISKDAPKDSKGKNAYDYLKNYYPQDKLNDDSDIVSGFDFRGLINPKFKNPLSQNKTGVVEEQICPQRLHKYICNQLNNTDIPKWYRGWKEVVYFPPFTIYQVRIRWTSTEYNTTDMPNPYPYFRVPEDQLLEYPGYVYHCHFLNHEDNELMRPIMMQPSDQFAENYKPEDLPIGQCIEQEKAKPENKDKTEWEVRYNCINGYVGCQ